jgi:ketose-bisphosphate aldolase
MTSPHVNTSGGMERAGVLSLRDALKQAIRKGVALAHFNVADLVILKGVFAAAQELEVPLVVGVSEDERKFVGVRQIGALVRSLREEFDFPIFLNADHTHSLASAIDVARAGFDSIVFDLSALPMEENIRQTKAAVELLKGINPAILIEGEIGDIGTGSGIHDASPELKTMTTPEEAKHFVDATGIDILAPAVGNMHGMLQSMVEGTNKKHLDTTRIAQIKDVTGALITLHGASGTDDDDLRRAIAAGINIIHINTELRVAWRRGLDKSLAERPNEVVPYKILPGAFEAVKRVATERLKLFNNLT